MVAPGKALRDVQGQHVHGGKLGGCCQQVASHMCVQACDSLLGSCPERAASVAVLHVEADKLAAACPQWPSGRRCTRMQGHTVSNGFGWLPGSACVKGRAYEAVAAG